MASDQTKNSPDKNQSEHNRPDPLSKILKPAGKFKKDPVAVGFEPEQTNDIATQEQKSNIDQFSVKLYDYVASNPKNTVLILLSACLIMYAVTYIYQLLINPILIGLTLVSIIPAFVLVLLLRLMTKVRIPRKAFLITFLISTLFTNFALIPNQAFGGLQQFQIFGVLGFMLFYAFVVAPGEEVVKILAVRVHAYRLESFDTVLAGVMYGAIAGLGFASLENVLYISGGTAPWIRAIAAPGHVIYSSIAGYYLALGKFNPKDGGPIIIKGILIAAFSHAVYNTLSTFGTFGQGLAILWLLIVFVFLYRKIRAYRRLAGAAEVSEESRLDASKIMGQLTQLEELHNSGFITDDEFDVKRGTV